MFVVRILTVSRTARATGEAARSAFVTGRTIMRDALGNDTKPEDSRQTRPRR